MLSVPSLEVLLLDKILEFLYAFIRKFLGRLAVLKLLTCFRCLDIELLTFVGHFGMEFFMLLLFVLVFVFDVLIELLVNRAKLLFMVR